MYIYLYSIFNRNKMLNTNSMLKIIVSITLISLISLTKALNSIQGKIILTPDMSNRRSISPMLKSRNMSVEISGPETRMTFVSEDGSFVFNNVKNGMYTVYVNDEKLEYENYIVEVNDEEVSAYQRNYKTGKGFKVKYPVQIKPIANIIYEEESQNVVNSIIKSPYMIIIGLTVVMFLCMKAVPQDQLQEQFKQVNKSMHQYSKGNFNQ